ncbi:MAG: tetratricopeptide repeat protein [Bacteroidales bacterium]|nr:tetratricopeptide repeat protein [Bacteroidales bacterium]
MKQFLTILAFLACIGLFSACGGNTTDNMPREDALKVLDDQIKKKPDNPDLLFQRGKLLISLGKEKNLSQYFKDAIADLKHATELDDKHTEYFTALGDAYFSLGNVDDSYSALHHALKLDENNFEACMKMGEIAFYSGNYDLAMENLNKVTAQDKDNQTALFMKGFIYMETGDTTNAVLYFRRLTELYPDYAPAYEQLGMLYIDNSNKLGLEYLTTALNLDPGNVNILYGIAQFYQDAEEADMANEYYVKIIEINPQFKYAWFNRGRMELELYEDYNAAIDFFNKAIEIDPQFAEAYHNKGVAYEMLGDKTNAGICYAKAQELGFTH